MGRDEHDLFAAAALPVAALDDAQRLACLRLIRSENVGPVTFRALINQYGGAQQALAALPEVGRRSGSGRALRVCPAARAEDELAATIKAGARILFSIEPGYPAALAFLDGSPPMLYAKGRVELLGGSIVAIVGSRQSSAAGVQLTRQLAAGLGAAGVVVASGLARGIDAAAHQAALGTGTIAVLAGGIDVVYPPEHGALQAEIGARGCLIAEQPLGFQPRAQDFPRRNRIISGIARAVVVVEAARRSGSLITARLAGEQGREVFAVPGHPLDPRAEGTNQLLKDGATMVTGPEDVLAALAAQSPLDPAPRTQRLPPAEPGLSDVAAPVQLDEQETAEAIDAVVRALGPAPVALDELARTTALPIRIVQVAALELALAGRVEFHGAQLVSLKALG